jgi:hypothetical protein
MMMMIHTQLQQQQFHVLCMIGVCVVCCMLCVYDDDDDVTESIFKIKIDINIKFLYKWYIYILKLQNGKYYIEEKNV